MSQKLNAFVLVVGFLSVFGSASAGFTEGEACNEINTAHLHGIHFQLPLRPVKCLEVTKLTANRRLSLSVINTNLIVHNSTTLYASSIGLRHIPVKLMQILAKLELIDLSQNIIRRSILHLDKYSPKVQTLLLDRNEIISPSNRAVIKSKSLRTLVLSQNRLSSVENYHFRHLPSLRALSLDHNQIGFVSMEAFVFLKELLYLDLRYNQLTQVPAISFPKILKHFYYIPLWDNEKSSIETMT